MKKYSLLILVLIICASATGVYAYQVRMRMTSPTTSGQVLGDSVNTVSYKTTATVNVRANPSVGAAGTILGRQPAGSLATMEVGTSTVVANGYTWGKFIFTATGLKGWVAMNSMTMIEQSNTSIKYKTVPIDTKLAFETYTKLKQSGAKKISLSTILLPQHLELGARYVWVSCFSIGSNSEFPGGSWTSMGSMWINADDWDFDGIGVYSSWFVSATTGVEEGVECFDWGETPTGWL